MYFRWYMHGLYRALLIVLASPGAWILNNDFSTGPQYRHCYRDRDLPGLIVLVACITTLGSTCLLLKASAAMND